MKKKVNCMILLGLTILVIGGCGQWGNDAGGTAPNEASPDKTVSDETSSGSNAAEMTVYRVPPVIELYPASEEGDSLLVKPCGYMWNWPEGAEQMGCAVADGPAPTADGTHWDTLILPEDRDGLTAYTLTIEVKPDELGIDAWEMTDIGNNDAKSSRIAVYQGEEISAADFSVPLQAGKVYQIYMEWEDEKVAENGCFGTAYYVFKTAWPVQEEEEDGSGDLTEKGEEQPEFPTAAFGDAYTEEISSVDGVTMTVTDVTSEGASLEILNQTDKEITFGDAYELQVWQDGSWYQVNYIIDNWAFHDIAYVTGTDRENDSPLCLDVKWAYFHGILPAGRYRITKTADVQEGDDSVKYCLAAEFEVE